MKSVLFLKLKETKCMAEKDVVYALELLHAVQIKRECLGFASFVDEKFKNLTKPEKDKLWAKYLNKNKDE